MELHAWHTMSRSLGGLGTTSGVLSLLTACCSFPIVKSDNVSFECQHRTRVGFKSQMSSLLFCNSLSWVQLGALDLEVVKADKSGHVVGNKPLVKAVLVGRLLILLAKDGEDGFLSGESQILIILWLQKDLHIKMSVTRDTLK